MKDKLLELDHLQKAEASWFRHWYMALYFASIAIVAGLIGIIHAFIPQLFGFLPYKLCKKITDGTEKKKVEDKPKVKKIRKTKKKKIMERLMFEYKCKILRIVDGDTVDVDIDLGFGIWRHRERVRSDL